MAHSKSVEKGKARQLTDEAFTVPVDSELIIKTSGEELWESNF
jgi:hypothetical protein